MHTRLLAQLAGATLLLTAIGCVGPAGTDGGDGTGESSSALFRPPIALPPALPVVYWQFARCLEPDYRLGLVEAMLALAQHGGPSEVTDLFVGAIGDSKCISGEERGGLFLADTFGDRTRGLTQLDVLPPYEDHAFGASYSLRQAVTAAMWSHTPTRYDENGNETAGGRFVLSFYSEEPAGRVYLSATDSVQGKQVGIRSESSVGPDGVGGVACGNSIAFTWYPAGDPLYVKIDQAMTPLINRLKNPNDLEYKHSLLGLGSICAIVRAISPSLAPSLAGWPLPLDAATITYDGNLLAYGGRLIW